MVCFVIVFLLGLYNYIFYGGFQPGGPYRNKRLLVGNFPLESCLMGVAQNGFIPLPFLSAQYLTKPNCNNSNDGHFRLKEQFPGLKYRVFIIMTRNLLSAYLIVLKLKGIFAKNDRSKEI